MNNHSGNSSAAISNNYSIASPEDEIYEVSAAQRELWLSEKFTENFPFNIWSYALIEGDINFKRLQQAFNIVLNEMPYLHAHFFEKNGELYQYQTPRAPDSMIEIDFSNGDNPKQRAINWMHNDAYRVISATDQDLLRFALLKLAPETYLFYRRAHHILFDGRSGEELTRRIVLNYNALSSHNPLPEFEPSDFNQLNESDARYRSSPRFATDKAFWQDYTTDMPRTLTRKEQRIPYADTLTSASLLEEKDVSWLEELARNTGVKRAHIFLAATALLFYNVTGQCALNFSLPVTGTREKHCIGMTSNVIPLIINITPEKTISEFIQQVAADIAKIMRFQLYRGEDIRRDQVSPDSSWFGPAINIISFDHGVSFAGCRTQWYYGGNIAVNDLQIMFYENPQTKELDVMLIDAEYAHSQPQLDALQQRLLEILLACCSRPESSVAEFDQYITGQSENDVAGSFYAHRRLPAAAGFLCWDQPAAELQRFANALHYGAKVCPIKILLPDQTQAISAGSLKVIPSDCNANPGTLLAIHHDGWEIATGSGAVMVGAFRHADGTSFDARLLAQRYQLQTGSQLPLITRTDADLLARAYAAAAPQQPFWQPRLTHFAPIVFPVLHQQQATTPSWKNTAWQQYTGQRGAEPVLTALAIYLARMENRSDFQIGWLEAERIRLRERTGALCQQTLPLQISLDTTQTFPQIQEALRHEYAQALSRTPYYPAVMVNHADGSQQVWPTTVLLLPGQHHEMASGAMMEKALSSGARAILQISKEDGAFRWFYDAASVPEQYIQRANQHLLLLLQQAASAPQSAVQDYALVTDDEHDQLKAWNETTRDYPVNHSVHALFEARAQLTPHACAVECGDKSLSYAELNARANQLALHLIEKGISPESRVAVCSTRSADMIVALLAVLKAGGAYIPLDPSYPGERLQYILQDAAPVLLIADEIGRRAVGEQPLPILNLEQPLPSMPAHAPPQNQTQPHHLAYVIYTSGSTGNPKGVMVEHRSLTNLIMWHLEASGLQPGERTPNMAGVGFDASVWEIWPALTQGATVLLPPPHTVGDSEALLTWWSDCDAHVAFMITPLAEVALANGNIPPTLRKLLIGGDRLRRWPLPAPPHLDVINNYGPTEATVVVTSGPANTGLPVPSIGRALTNTRLYLLDPQGKQVPLGAIGELYIGGTQVARGYLNRPDLTAERFIDDPFEPNGRLYRTGDLMRFLPDGSLEYIGRNDQQVKIRGFRIELGEIEAQLAAHPAVNEAVVDAVEDADGNARLIAWIVPQKNADTTALPALLRQHIGTALPSYMAPAAYMLLEALPLSPNGKVDRRALPPPTAESFQHETYEAPQGDTETLLATIWSELLGVERIGRHDNFFELGGHSLLAVKLAGKLRQAGLPADGLALFSNPTLSALAQALTTQHDIDIPENRIPPDCPRITPDMLPLVTLSQDEIDALTARLPGGSANVQDIYALSPLQEGILFHYLLAEEGDPYLLSALLRFSSRDLLDRWLAAMQQVIDRHDILRTAFFCEGLSTPVQVVYRNARLSLTEPALDPQDGEIGRQLLERYHPRHTRQDITQPPLIHFVAAPQPDGSWCVLQQWHHLIGDHSTLALMIKEVNVILDGNAHTLPGVQPFRNAVAQARLGPGYDEHERFFRAMLDDIDEPVLPYGISDIHGDGQHIADAQLILPTDLNQRLRQQAKRLGISLATLCHLAWALIIARTSCRDVAVFGTVLLGRMAAGEGVDRAMGLFINTLPLRLDIDDAETEVAVRRAHVRLSELLAHEHATLALAQRCSNIPAGTPLFNALLNYRHNNGEGIDLPQGVTLLDAEERTNYPLVLSVDDNQTSLVVTAQVASPIEPQRICSYMQRALHALADALEHAPDTPLCELAIIPDDEVTFLLEQLNDTARDYCQAAFTHDLIATRARQMPQASALICGDGRLSYAQLNQKANGIAHDLIARGIGPESRIALCSERSIGMIAALLAIFKTGAAYVPLDPAYASERLHYILQDSQAVLLIADAAGRKALGQHDTPMLSLEDVDRLPTRDDDPPCRTQPEQLAYIIYTSGSTGQPKGVMVEHRQLLNLIHWYAETIGLQAGEYATSMAGLSFDGCVWEVWPALVQGATLLLPPPHTVGDPEALLHWWRDSEAQISYVITPLAEVAIASNCLPANLRQLLIGGDIIRSWPLAVPEGVQVRNSYGPTESTVLVTSRIIEATSPAASIGYPIANTRIYLLDHHQQLVPLGAVGELHVGGAQVARGYLNRPELTQTRFLPDPFIHQDAMHMYRTGDLARWLPDGSLEFLGRNDEQVKIRGYRVEPGEVAIQLAEHPGIREAAVQACGQGESRYLAAWWVAASEGPAPDAEELHCWMSGRLPEYMVPRSYTRLEAMPLTTNGKLDRRALPEPDNGAIMRSSNYEAPRAGLEEQLAAIWRELLPGAERIGRNDNFMALGGHSLLAVRMVNRVKALGYPLSLQQLFITPELSTLAEALTNPSGATGDAAIAIRREGEHAPLFFTPSGFGDYVYAFELAKHIDPAFPVYALPWPDEAVEQPATLAELTTRMVGMIRKVQPDGPYYLAGYSSGGVLAWEVAARLQDEGEQIAFVGLIDTLCPPVPVVFGPEHMLLHWLRATRQVQDNDWLQSLQNRPLDEIVDAVQRAGISTQSATWRQCFHYAQLIETANIVPHDLDIHLFKARQEDQELLTDLYSHGQVVIPAGYCREDDSPMGWDTALPAASITVQQIGGNHNTMMIEQAHRQELAASLTAALRKNLP